MLVSDWARTRSSPPPGRDARRRARETGARRTAAATPTTTAPRRDDRARRHDDRAGQPEEKTRKPDFEVAGAPVEPLDEMPLPDRARALERRLAGNGKPPTHLINFWLYQHSWIVTGARFGWHDGAQALRILIKVDQSLERRFGFGARSEVVARRALAYVEAQAK